MSYIALARKWRPRTFSQLIGQDHVSQALVYSLKEQRLHHAYMFTGTRGVGKTSIARLLAKAMNCDKGISPDSCLKCESCLSIEQGCFLDLIEIDAASKTGVEDTRKLLDNAQYLPTQGRFKVYLIDEAHMLSQSSFNAMLKTLEEPPNYVKFFLATTDPQKIPATVLSRCLQFSLRAIGEQDIAAQLCHILNTESLPFEREAIDLIAHCAQGSMRDSLSLLDQALAIGNQQVTLHLTQKMLGHTHQDYALHILQALVEGNAKKMLSLAVKIGQEGGQYRYVTEKLLEYLHQMMIYQQVGNSDGVLYLPDELCILANHWSGEDLQIFYQILLHGQEELSLAPMPGIGFDVMLIRLFQFEPLPKQEKPGETPITENSQVRAKSGDKTKNSDAFEKKNEVVMSQHVAPSVPTLPKVPQMLGDVVSDNVEIKTSDNLGKQELKKELAGGEKIPSDNQEWERVITKLDLTGMARTALDNTSLKSIDDTSIHLITHSGHLSLFIPSVKNRISKALASYFKRSMKLHIEEVSEVKDTPAKIKAQKQVENKKKAIDLVESDPVVQQIKENFSANVFENSIIFRADEL